MNWKVSVFFFNFTGIEKARQYAKRVDRIATYTTRDGDGPGRKTNYFIRVTSYKRVCMEKRASTIKTTPALLILFIKRQLIHFDRHLV